MSHKQMYQLIVFVPDSHKEEVKEALFSAGAGRYNNYEKCSFEVKGTGQFRPLEDSSPFIGKPGNIEKVSEYRVEMICSAANKDKVLENLVQSHPYEEPAYHFIPVEI